MGLAGVLGRRLRTWPEDRLATKTGKTRPNINFIEKTRIGETRVSIPKYCLYDTLHTLSWEITTAAARCDLSIIEFLAGPL